MRVLKRSSKTSYWQVGDLPHNCRSMNQCSRGTGLRPVRDFFPSQLWACWYCKPVSVPRRAAVIPLGRASLPGSSNLPGSLTERAAPPPLFGLAPHGVYPAGADYSVRGALLPHLFTLTRNSGENPSPGGIFSVALSVKPALSGPPRPLAGMLPYGDRTFLPILRTECS